MPETRPSQPPGRLVLASASPRRKDLLEAAGIPCAVLPSRLDECQGEHESAEAFARRAAEEKARHVLQQLPAAEDAVVLGADTVVVIDGQTLGKPASAEEAAQMLRLLSGRQHRVLTAVCLARRRPSPQTGPETIADTRLASTTVQFASLSEQEIAAYVASGEPFDKAGGYGIQGLASKFVERIEGCYFNVVGLPVSLVYAMLKEWGAAPQR